MIWNIIAFFLMWEEYGFYNASTGRVPKHSSRVRADRSMYRARGFFTKRSLNYPASALIEYLQAERAQAERWGYSQAAQRRVAYAYLVA